MNANFAQEFVSDDPEALREIGELLKRTIDIGLAFKARKAFFVPGEGKAQNEVMTESLPVDPLPLAAVLSELQTAYLPGMTNFGSPRFLGFPDAGNSASALAGAILGELLNVNLINSTFCARVATEMEIATIRWMRAVVGYPEVRVMESAADVGGMVLTGGTMANYTAVLIARERAAPGTMVNGISYDPGKLRVVIPESIGHYTVAASMAWAGLGSGNIIRVPIRDFRYDQAALGRTLEEVRERGEKVAMVVAYAGDSRTMTIEDLVGVHDLVRSFDASVWLHCDGCHGTSLSFSAKLRDRLAGIELWDSITLDPHKVLAVPYPISLLLVRDPAGAASILTESDLIMRQAMSLGQMTPVLGSKAFLALRLWVAMKTLGTRGLGRMVEERCALAQRFADLVDSHPELMRINSVQINSVVFVYVPQGVRLPMSETEAEALSTLNRHIYERILREGEFYIHSFVGVDSLNMLGCGADFRLNVLRYMSGNPITTTETLDEAIEYIVTLGRAAVLRTE
jgi:L-2,4-diaminobutyrate decarboxylase